MGMVQRWLVRFYRNEESLLVRVLLVVALVVIVLLSGSWAALSVIGNLVLLADLQESKSRPVHVVGEILQYRPPWPWQVSAGLAALGIVFLGLLALQQFKQGKPKKALATQLQETPKELSSSVPASSPPHFLAQRVLRTTPMDLEPNDATSGKRQLLVLAQRIRNFIPVMEKRYPKPVPRPKYDELDEDYNDLARSLQGYTQMEAETNYEHRHFSIGLTFNTRFSAAIAAAFKTLNEAGIEDAQMSEILEQYPTLQISGFEAMLLLAERLEAAANRISP